MLWVRSHMVRKKVCGVHNKEDKPMVPSGRTSGTPSPCCLTGKPTGFHQVGILIKCYWMPSAIKWEKNSLPGESSATLKCSGSGKHGCTFEVKLESCNEDEIFHHPIQINVFQKSKWSSHAPGYGALFTGGRGLVGLTLDAEVHDVVPESLLNEEVHDVVPEN